MAKKEEEAFKEWVSELESKLKTDEEKSAFSVFSQSEAGRESLRGSMRRGEFDRRLNDLHETRQQLEVKEATLKNKHAELAQWYNEEAPKNQALVQELNTLKTKLREVTGEDDIPAARATLAQGQPSKSEDFSKLEQRLNLLDGNTPRLLGDMAAIVKRSIKEDFDIDPREVIAYSIKHQVDPFRAYEDITHEARAERFEKDRETEREKWKEEGKKEALKTIKSSPDHIRTPGPNVVDFLRGVDPPSTPRTRVDAAVRDFMEMGATI